MPNLAAKAKEEVQKILIIAVFFAIGFSILVLHTRLLTERSQIRAAPSARANIGGLIVAKVLMTVDLLPFVHAFPEKPLVHNIAWKSSLYIAASVVVFYIEPFVKGLIKGEGFDTAHSRPGMNWRTPNLVKCDLARCVAVGFRDYAGTKPCDRQRPDETHLSWRQKKAGCRRARPS